MALVVSAAVQEKLATKHDVTIAEVEECFANRNGRFLMDTRSRHKSNPPTLWFIAPSDAGRNLKVVFIRKGNDLHLKSSFEPDDVELQIYARFGQS
jgi:hypothetical protein